MKHPSRRAVAAAHSMEARVFGGRLFVAISYWQEARVLGLQNVTSPSLPTLPFEPGIGVASVAGGRRIGRLAKGRASLDAMPQTFDFPPELGQSAAERERKS